MTTWTTTPARPDTPDAVTLLGEYMEEMVRRYHRRPARPGEVAAALAELPSDDLAPPTGILLLAYHDGRLAGCAGLRFRPDWAELTRVYVRTPWRGTGGGAALLAAVEEQARAAGADRIRLDTRADLVEARALYARHGYVEIPAYNAGRYAEHWFEKTLRPRVDDARPTRSSSSATPSTPTSLRPATYMRTGGPPFRVG